MNPSKVLTITVNPALDLSAVVHSFHAGGVNRIHSQQEDAGGKGINVASFLVDFDVPVRVSGFLGCDNDQSFHSLFQKKNIENAFLSVAGRTRTNIKLIDESCGADGITDLNFPGFSIDDEHFLKLLNSVPELTRDVSWCVISGSLPEGVSVDSYSLLIRCLQKTGVKIALDTSGEALKHGVSACPDLIKPNEAEIEGLLGRRISKLDDALNAALSLQKNGIKTIILSLGAKGAIFCEGDEALHAFCPKAEVRSTVGAGDAMVAGYLLGSIRGLNLLDKARLASAFSVGAIGELGPRLPQRSRIEELIHTIQTQVLRLP